MTLKHSFQLDQQGTRGRVLVDGIDISSAVRSVTLDGHAWEIPRVTLELEIHDITTISSSEAELLIPEATASALEALGWMPPTDENEQVRSSN